jgi:hypothetical protein
MTGYLRSFPTFTYWKNSVLIIILQLWLRHYAASQNIVDLRPDEVNFSSIYLILPAVLGPGVHSASNRNEYQKQKNNVYRE